MRRVLLMDNGSLEPESTLQLRKLATALSDRISLRVDPVSLAHSAKIPREALEGRPAELFEAALDRGWREGVQEFVAVPLFVGPSHAIIRHVPALIEERRRQIKGFRARVAPPLFVDGDPRLGKILADNVRDEMTPGVQPRVALVDHGSPNPEVTMVRDRLAIEVKNLLGSDVANVQPCSMERREGPEYDFNEPLLRTLLSRPDWANQPVVLGMLFIAPGKHAGPDGDIINICREVRGGDAASIKMTKLIGQHPLLIDILADRAEQQASAG
jgi:sirohydrochlorin ferrochelatase